MLFKRIFPTPPDPDMDCWRAITKGGKEREWGCTQLYLRYSGQLKAMFSQRHLSDLEVEDLVQDVFVKLIKGAATFSADRKFRTWLFAIAHNILVDHLRKTSREPDPDLADEGIQPNLDQNEHAAQSLFSGANEALVKCVQESFDAFAQRYPERAFVIQLAVLDGLCSKEVAKIIGKEDGATRQYISQCRKKFKPFLERCRIYLDGDHQ